MGMASLACWFAVVQAIIAMDLLSQIWCSLSKGRERYWLLQSDYVQPPCLCRERHRLVEVPPPGHAHHRNVVKPQWWPCSATNDRNQIGRASCRERVSQSV